MPFLLRATPRQDLAGRSLRSEANLTAAGHSRDTPDQTPDATKHHRVVPQILHQGQSAPCARLAVPLPAKSYEPVAEYFGSEDQQDEDRDHRAVRHHELAHTVEQGRPPLPADETDQHRADHRERAHEHEYDHGHDK